MPYDIIIGRDAFDKKKFGKRGLIFIGKSYVTMGNYTSLSNRIFMDVARTHVILISGKRGSGKSYSIGVIAEEITDLPEEEKKNVASLIFDTMGIFWTMKYKNEKERELLEEWDLKPKNLSVVIWVPHGYFEYYLKKEIPADRRFALAASELNIEDWISIFDLDITSPVSVFIQKIISGFSREYKNFYIDDIIDRIKEEREVDENIKNSALSLFEVAKSWKIFAERNEEATRIDELIVAGKTSILDLSVYPSTSKFNVRAMVIGLISKKLFEERMLARKKEEVDYVQHHLSTSYEEKREMPLVWLFIDESHEFLPMDEKTSATSSLLQLLREGRQPGISLVLATQQPGVIHRDVMTQSDIVISHRLTNKEDLAALNTIMQSYVFENISKTMNNLPDLKGSAIILDDNSERIYPVRIRPRLTWPGGESPRLVKYE